MIISIGAVGALVSPADLRSPVLALLSIFNRDSKLLETPLTDRKHDTEPGSNRDKIAPLTSMKCTSTVSPHARN